MKNRRLFIHAAIFLLLVPLLHFPVLAGNDCWNIHMTQQMTACTKNHTDCTIACSPMVSDKRLPCFRKCSDIADECRNQASVDYKSCVGSDSQSAKQSTTKQITPVETPVRTTQNNQQNQDIDNLMKNVFGVFDPNAVRVVPDLSDQSELRLPKITKKTETEAFGRTKRGEESPYWVGFINMMTDKQPLIKYPDSDEYVPFDKFSEIKPGSTIRSGDNKISIEDNRGGFIYVESDSEVTIYDPVKDKSLLRLYKGEIEVKEQKGNTSGGTKIETDFFDVEVIGTHFWVSKDGKNKQAVVGVYEGEVKVITKNGTITPVVPNGDKPAVVVVTQKLSITKLALGGLVLIVVILGIYLFKRTGKKISVRRR